MLTPKSALAKDRRTAQAVPKFQHRHFAYLASAIADHRAIPGKSEQAWLMAFTMGNALARTNPNFDWDRWLTACGFPKPNKS